MVGPPRGPPRPPMAPQPPAQPHHQLILKQVTAPFTMLKPPTSNYVNYLSLPVMPGNGSFLAVNSKPGETNGTTFLTVAASRPGGTYTENNNSGTLIAMDSLPQAHQYLIPKQEPFTLRNYAKHEPIKRRAQNNARPTNHQRLKDAPEEDEGEEVRPILDPGVPFLEQVVKMDHSYPLWLPSPSPREDDKESTISSDEKLEHNEEGEETETAAEGEDSITRCICNLEHDDGYMISCDQCYVWQHVACVLPDTPPGSALPDLAYLCDICQPRELDRHRARALQMQRRKQILQREESSDDSWSSTDRAQPTPKKAVARRRAEAIPRRLGKRDSSDGPRKGDVRPKKLDGLLEGTIRSKLLKVGSKNRRDSKVPPPPSLPSAQSVGRRTKLKRKFESKANQRRKSLQSKIKEGSDSKLDKEEERKRIGELRPRAAVDRQVGNKSRCRLSYAANGEPIVVTTCRVTAGEPLCELRGKYLQSSGAAPKPEVLFHYRFPKDGTEVLMDGSGRENMVRHARRCCAPNAQLKHCLVKGSLRLYVVALKTLERNQQVTIPHGCVTESAQAGVRETCGKDCTYHPNNFNQKLLSPRRRSRRTTVSEESDREGDRDALRSLSPLSPTHSDRKLTREEKKIEQAMKIFAQMEKDTARKRDKVTGAVLTSGYRRGADSDKESPGESGKPRRRRRRRKRRNSRKSRLPSGSGTGSNALQSGDDSDVSSGDDLPSPRDKNDKDSGRDEDDEKDVEMDDAAGLLLALGGARHHAVMTNRTPPREPRDHSENDSSPSTPLSSACLLVAAAVGPLAPGFKFPKTKKGMMNEWLGKSPDHVPAELSPSAELGPSVSHEEMALPPGAPKLSNLSHRLYYPVRDQCAGFAAGFGKKRWLRQAINEYPPENPPEPPDNPDNGTPLKKRRLARESLTSDPPATPPPGLVAANADDDVLFGNDESPKSPSPSSGAPVDLAERVRAMQKGYLAEQGIEEEVAPVPSHAAAHMYHTSPQRVPENLTLSRSCSPCCDDIPASSPFPTDPRPARRGRKRPALRGDPRTSPRVKRSTRQSESDTSIEKLEVEQNGEVKVEPEEDIIVKVETNLDPRRAGLSIIHSVKREEQEPFINEVKTHAWCGVIKKEDHSTSNMDLLAMEASKELKKPVPSYSREAVDDVDAHEDKNAPARRKLSITEYLKRKKGTEPKSVAVVNKSEDRTGKQGQDKVDKVDKVPLSPTSDDDISPLLLPTSFLPLPPLDGAAKGSRFKVEPTELERQRENLNERLRREFGLVITDDESARAAAEPPLPPMPPIPPPPPETNGFSESSPELPTVQNLPQSAIYPEGSSNPPNPFVTPFPAPAPATERRKFRK